jgi:hypothetical protein
MGHGPSEIEPTLAKRARHEPHAPGLEYAILQRPIANATSIDDEGDAHPLRVAAVSAG